MQFEVGDFVVHPAYGVGHIVKVEQRQFSEQEARLYYEINLPRRTLWIPVEAPTNGLRAVTARSELDRYRDLLKSTPAPLHQNYHKRHLELNDRLSQCSFRGLCEVVRDLTAWGREKSLGSTDNATLQKTRESLFEEWAAAAGISVREAVKEVESLLRESTTGNVLQAG